MSISNFFKKYIFILLLVSSQYGHAQVWELGNHCGFQGCANIKADSLFEYCKVFTEANIKAGQNEGNLVEVDIMYIAGDQAVGQYVNKGACILSPRPPYFFRFEVANWSHNKCPAGTYLDKTIAACVKKDRIGCTAGNPIEVDTGIKVQVDVDYTYKIGSGKFFELKRVYENKVNPNLNDAELAIYGGYWNFIFNESLSFAKIKNESTELYFDMVKVSNVGMHPIFFISSDSFSWENRNTGKEILDKVDESGTAFWRLRLSDNITKFFTLDGKLVKIIDPSLGVFNISYRDVLLNSVNYVFEDVRINNSLVFSYQFTEGQLIGLYDSNQLLISSYSYDSLGNLIAVLYGNGKQKKYHYEDPTYKKALTGITDERGVRYASWSYDTQGRAVSSEHAGGAEKTLLTFNADGSTTVTNALNKKTTYHFADIAGARRTTSVEGEPTTNCVGANQNYTYTPEGWVASKTDWNGNKTTYSYNTKGQETSRTEAFGTTVARTIATEWHPTLNLKTKVTEPGKETTYSYDINGFLLNQKSRSLP